MLTSSAISALALAGLFAPQDAHAASCTTSGPAGTYVNICVGSSPTPPPTPGTGEYGRPAFPGETPVVQPISIAGDYNGANGTGTVQITNQGGNGSAGGAGGPINDPFTDYTNGAAGGTGGNGGTLTATISSGKILDGGNATSPVSIIANGGQGGEGGMPGFRGTGGGGGRGGSGGTIHFTLGQAAQVISTKAGVAAIDIQAFGALGGNAQQAQTHHDHAYGQTGGDGGAGGTIGDASAPITIMGIIQSAGSGVVAHSVGAKAGRGGSAGNDSGDATGGNGGTGGGAGGFNIVLASGGSISATGSSTPGQGTTIGDSALSLTFSEVTAGIYALSTGGEGGDGAMADGGLVGGTGGNGGSANGDAPVFISNLGGTIDTSGYLSVGMLAQSLGGHGGNGSYGGGMFVSKGGAGKPGGDGGALTLTGNLGSITTTGYFSAGMVGQSIGGSGGFGGNALVNGPVSSVTVGGQGGSGGNGSAVTINNGVQDSANSGNWIDGSTIRTSGNRAIAIMGQSIGGGGGNGGDAVSHTLIGTDAVAIGGKGGGGGNGATTTIRNAQAISTAGKLAYGVLGQSIGGGGGNGGSAFAIDVSGGGIPQVVTAVGGSGGGGGSGGEVDIYNFKTLVTAGDGSIGVMAQSIGGGGGNGGSSAADMITLNPPIDGASVPDLTMTVNVGGSGGIGGTGGNVTLTNTGSIVTNGTGAWGTLLQSIGGGGGNGGDTNALQISVQAPTVSINTAIGGKGGTGGDAGTVTLNNDKGLIETHGDDAIAVFAQSIGGGGGNGGASSSRNINLMGTEKDFTVNLNMSIGGSGGAGGDGGAVTINNDGGSILTTSSNSKGVFAQSIGGGGGWGGGAAAAGSGASAAKFTADVSLGGSGGQGNPGGIVTVVNDGVIYTTGSNSAAIYAQSIGGGGGTGGSAATDSSTDGNVQVADYLAGRTGVNGDVTQVGDGLWSIQEQFGDAYDRLKSLKEIGLAYEELRPEPGSSTWYGKAVNDLTVNVGAGRGGKGGSAGGGGQVIVTNTSVVETARAYSDGIFAQSVGGGGGDGGAANATANATSIDAGVALGGTAGSGGTGGDVTVTNTGSVTTAGDLAHGINAQSIAGGGGRGGVTVGNASEFNILTLSIGGDGGAYGDAGAVTITSSGTIATGVVTTVGLNRGPNGTAKGDGSIGILAQSIGAGGGQVSLLGTITSNSGAAESSYSPELIPEIPTIKIGGKDGAGGNGGAVGISLNGTIATNGKDAYGILAQSVGGSGGIVFAPTTMADKSNPEAMFGGGTLYGTGADVSVEVSSGARITTQGDGAVGILAQSIGGGGGLIGGMSGVDVTSVATTSSTIHQGSGGNVSISADSGSMIETFGARAHGVIAQSASGGGFFSGNSAGAGFAVSTTSCGNVCQPTAINVQLNGEVAVHGAGSYGVFAQNRGGPAGGTVIVQVSSSGGIVADKQSAGAIYIDNPNGTSTVANYDYIGATGPGLVAINGTAATIENHFYLSGDLLTTSGAHVVNNYAGASLLPASRIVASALNNSGSLVIGYAAPSSVTLTGNLNNSGWIVFNMPASGTPASLTVNGTATLSDGSFIGILGSPVQVEKFTALTAGTLSVAGGLSAGQVQFVGDRFSPLPNPTFSFSVATNGNTLTVTPQLNNSSQLGVSLTPNEAATADHLSAAFAAGNAGYARKAFEGIYQKAPTADKYKTLLDEIGGHTLGAMLSSRLPLQRIFIENMMSCPDFVGDGMATNETSCVWARLQQSWLGSNHDAGFDTDARRYQMGVQVEVGDGWFLGASGGYEDEQINSRSVKAHLQGDVFSLGALVKRVAGNWTLAASATGTIGNFDTHRALSISNDAATASPTTQGLALQLRAAYQVPMAGWYLRPGLSVTGHYLHLDAFTEKGSDFPLQIASSGNWSLAVAPSLEVGTRVEIGKTGLRPFVRGGVLYEHNNDWAHQASLVNATFDLGSYTSQIKQPDWSATVAAGLDAYAGERLTLRLEYSGEFNGDTRAHTATLKLGYRF